MQPISAMRMKRGQERCSNPRIFFIYFLVLTLSSAVLCRLPYVKTSISKPSHAVPLSSRLYAKNLPTFLEETFLTPVSHLESSNSKVGTIVTWLWYSQVLSRCFLALYTECVNTPVYLLNSSAGRQAVSRQPAPTHCSRVSVSRARRPAPSFHPNP